MNQPPVTITVLDLDISFKAGADIERIREAARHVENMYADQKSRSQGLLGKDVLLTYVALGLADELLQLKTRQGQVQSCLGSLLAKIESGL